MIECDAKCGNVKHFWRFVVDSVSVDPDTGDTEFGDCEDANELLKPENTGIYCEECEGPAHDVDLAMTEALSDGEPKEDRHD